MEGESYSLVAIHSTLIQSTICSIISAWRHKQGQLEMSSLRGDRCESVASCVIYHPLPNTTIYAGTPVPKRILQ